MKRIGKAWKSGRDVAERTTRVELHAMLALGCDAFLCFLLPLAFLSHTLVFHSPLPCSLTLLTCTPSHFRCPAHSPRPDAAGLGQQGPVCDAGGGGESSQGGVQGGRPLQDVGELKRVWKVWGRGRRGSRGGGGLLPITWGSGVLHAELRVKVQGPGECSVEGVCRVIAE